MTGGAREKRKKLTVKDMRSAKGVRQLVEVFCDTPEQAWACEEAGIDMIVIPPNRLAEIREAAPHTCIVVPVLSPEAYSSDRDIIVESMGYLKNGADAIYTGAGFDRVRALADQYVPVIGHVGLVPYRNTWTGGFRAVGKDIDSALWVWEQTKRYEDSGAIAVEMEVVPAAVAAEISRRTVITIISMGSGAGCDAQYLFATDLLGINTGHIPRHAKTYRDFASEYSRLKKEAAAAFAEFREDVLSGNYPQNNHIVSVKDEVLHEFIGRIESPKEADGRGGN